MYTAAQIAAALAGVRLSMAHLSGKDPNSIHGCLLLKDLGNLALNAKLELLDTT